MPTADEIVVLPQKGNAVLVAGPGTGKTGKIEERVAFLLTTGTPVRDIVLLTLTRETRRTLRARVKDVSALTLHAYVLGRLNELGDASGKRVADEWETYQLVGPDVKLV